MATYYVKAAGGTGSGADDANAWSLAKLNSTGASPGDTVKLKRGDTFAGTLNVQSGVTYSTYGAGLDPVVTGLAPLTAWTQQAGSVYYASLDVPYLNVVTLNEDIRALGRHPKSGYLKYTAHNGNTTLTGTSIAGLPFDPTNAEIVVRKIRQVTDRHIVTSRTGDTVSLLAGTYGTVFGNNTTDQPSDGFGYFIQASLSCITQIGEWYYDRTAKRLYMHFGTDVPANYTVKAAAFDYSFSVNNGSNITFQNIVFEGANKQLVNGNNNDHFTFTNCTFRKAYNGIFVDGGMTYLTVQGGRMEDILNSGILIPQIGHNALINSVAFQNIGIIAGAGGSGNGQQIGCYIAGDHTKATNCTVENCGFHGIVLDGSNTLCEFSEIDNFGITKDDSAALYTAGHGRTGQIIRENIVRNASSSSGDGTVDGIAQVADIYVDNAGQVQVLNNTLKGGGFAGAFLVDVDPGVEVKNNLSYDHGAELYIYATKQITGLTVTGNTKIAKTAQQSVLYIEQNAAYDLSQMGTFNNNTYARPMDDDKTIIVKTNGIESKMNLAAWKVLSGLDAASAKGAIAVTNINKFRFDFNNTEELINISLDGYWVDVLKNYYKGSYTLASFRGKLLIYNGTHARLVSNGKRLTVNGKNLINVG